MTSTACDRPEAAHRSPRKGSELNVQVIELSDAINGGHLLIFGNATNGCLVRLHSRCLYGEVLGFQDCDCGPELEAAMDLIQAEGAGVLVYLEQEGRGAGLSMKARGLGLGQRDGLDTFESYHRLGLNEDLRDYKAAANALAALGLDRVRLMTNNPDKVAALREADIEVDVVPLHTEPQSEEARRYLAAKRIRRGHLLPE
ncbi:GTP cyclohydrolase II RibA [Nocardia harenae]|uniref:GTP cyclohydrolase II RibA n=1 Tax=Nocardia harenae TaxID=358707 RepID=UPI0008356DEE|nr:GTP cyclohydrolase II RibA [Nocardia harenae]